MESEIAIILAIITIASLIFLGVSLNILKRGSIEKESSSSTNLFSLIEEAKKTGHAKGKVDFYADIDLKELISHTLGEVNCSKGGYCIIGESKISPGTYTISVTYRNGVILIKVIK